MLRKCLYCAFLIFITIYVFAENIDDKITSFWKIVSKNENKYFNSELSTEADWKALIDSIKAIDSGLDALVMTEIINGKKRLIITVYGNDKLFGLADKIVAKAPKLKLLTPFSLFPRIKNIIPFTMNGKPLEVPDVKVHFDSPVKGKYDIIYMLPPGHVANVAYDKTDEYYKAYLNILFLYTLQVLGEKRMSDKISSYDMDRVYTIGPSVSLADLYDEIK